MDRKKVKLLRSERYAPGMTNFKFDKDAANNYNNPRVQAKKTELGGFAFEDDESDLGRREKRKIKTLENGAMYEGEWLVGSQTK